MNKDEKIVYINYFDTIDMKKVKALMGICANIIQQQQPDTLYFLLASPGGDVNSGIALYNYLKAIPAKIIMHNTSSIDSIANVIFSAGDERYASPGSTFLFHGVTIDSNGSIHLTLSQISEIKNRIEQNHQQIASIICENTKMEENDIKKLFLEGETKDTDFAIKHGIISAVKIPQVPKNGLFVSVNFND